jgi:hypothetical protein
MSQSKNVANDIPAGFKQMWSALPQDISFINSFRTTKEFAGYLASTAEDGATQRSTMEFIARLRAQTNLDIDTANAVLSSAGSPLYFSELTELIGFLGEVEAALRGKFSSSKD